MKKVTEFFQFLTIVIASMAVVFIAFVAITFPLFYFAAVCEARAFNRLTGSTATAWDAMWAELVVSRPAVGHAATTQ